LGPHEAFPKNTESALRQTDEREEQAVFPVEFWRHSFPETGSFEVAVDDATDVYTTMIRDRFLMTPELKLCLELTRPGDVVVDLGANLGHFTLPLAARGCRVVAVEALYRNFALLAAALVRNRFASVTPVHCAVWSEPAVLRINGHSAWGRVHSGPEGFDVPALTLDDIAFLYDVRDVKLLKIDIEGSEIECLKGAPRFFSVHRDLFVIVELNEFINAPGNRRVRRFFAENGFDMYLILDGKLVPRSEADFQEGVCSDYLAAPAGAIPKVRGFEVTPLTTRERAQIIIAHSKANEVTLRSYIRGNRQRIPPAILNEAGVGEALDELGADPDPQLAELSSIYNHSD
jgi:FkbM family methyltransferase